MDNNAEKLLFEDQSERLYQIFIKDESICGFASLFKLNKIGSKIGLKIKKYLYDKYGETFLKKISAVRTSKVAHQKRSKEDKKCLSVLKNITKIISPLNLDVGI